MISSYALASDPTLSDESIWGWGGVLVEDPQEVAEIGEKIQTVLGLYKGHNPDLNEECLVTFYTSRPDFRGNFPGHGNPEDPRYTWPSSRDLIFNNGSTPLAFSMRTASGRYFEGRTFLNSEVLGNIRSSRKTWHFGIGLWSAWFASVSGAFTAEADSWEITLRDGIPHQAVERKDLYVAGISSQRSIRTCRDLVRVSQY